MHAGMLDRSHDAGDGAEDGGASAGEPAFRDALPDGPVHRRGAGINPGNRFEAHRVLLRLPYQVKDLFLDWLQRNVHPDRARKVESLIRQSRGGKLYDAGSRPWKSAGGSGRRVGRVDDATSRMVATRETAVTLGTTSQRGGLTGPEGQPRGRGMGEHAWQIRRVFDVYCRKHGLNRDVRPLSRAHFRRPSLHGQIHLFGDG